MPIMIIMMGIQGSGKSTFCKERLPEYTRINLDQLHTRNKESIAIEAAFENRENMVIDNTNPTIADRKKYIDRAKSEGYKLIGYFMQSKINDCVARNEKREGKACVPNKAIACTSNKMELPSYEEGFDEIYFVQINEPDFLVEEWRSESWNSRS